MCINFPITVRLLQNNERSFPLIFTITVVELLFKTKQLIFTTKRLSYINSGADPGFFERGVDNFYHDNEIHRKFIPSEIGCGAKGPQCSGHIPNDQDLV
jgi:hypothetical protein